MDLGLKDRAALVTGGGGGIGEAIARTLAAEGCTVAVADRAAAAAARVAAAIRGHPLTVDVGDAAAVEAAFAGLRDTTGCLDILVNAAGLLSTGRVDQLPASEWERVARVNVAGIINCVKAALPLMTGRRGRIVNIASVAAARGGGSIGNTIYGASKASVVALTLGLARELGPQGITVNAVAPGVADTAMTRSALTDDVHQRIIARTPLGRLATVTDIANMVAFLASECASFITGAVVPIDGGILTT